MELKITEITKSYRDTLAVDRLSYTMQNGVYGLLGVNGAGKTTLLRMLCTLLKPTGGSITWDGEDIFQMGNRYREILGYLPQDFGFYPDFTVRDYLLYISSIKGLRPAAAQKRTLTLLKKVGMERAAGTKMKRLSGGMKRRVGIAQAMLNDPKILILDEPTAGLDPKERIRFRNLISELAEERLVLLSTHIVSDIEFIAKEILLMNAGKIQLSGTPEEIVSSMPVKVWSFRVSREAAEGYIKRYKVSNVKTVSDGAQLRVLADTKPVPEATEETAALEDVFLYYFGEKVGDEHDIF